MNVHVLAAPSDPPDVPPIIDDSVRYPCVLIASITPRWNGVSHPHPDRANDLLVTAADACIEVTGITPNEAEFPI